MAIENFKFYTDNLLTQALTANLIFVHNAGGGTGNVDKVLYIGSVNSAFTLKASANPDVDPIVLSLADGDASAGTPKVSDIKVALNRADLDSTTAGATLNLGTSIVGGAANALAIHVRSSQPDGVGVDLTISTNAVTES